MYKPRTILLFFLGLISSNLIAQRANLDKEHFRNAYVKLPVDPILDDAKRTFTSNLRNIGISGFSRVASNGTLDLDFRFHGTDIGEVDINKEKKEKKDKDGNVTETYYLYKAVVSYRSNATLTIGNAETGNNPSYNFSESDVYKSKTFNSSYDASKYYNNNRHNIRDKYRTDHKNRIIYKANTKVNYYHGYVPIERKSGEHFWIIATKKHPEYTKHQEAYVALKEIFAGIQYDQSVDEIKNSVQPWISYFEDVAKSFNEDDKKHRKVRYSSYFNIAKIYLVTEQFEKSKEYASKIVANDYDKKDGTRMIEHIDDILKSLSVNQLKTRHFEVLTEDLSNLPEVVEVVKEEVQADVEKTVAFVITSANDTIQHNLDVNSLLKNGDIAVAYDQNEVSSDIVAVDTKKIVLASGDSYMSIPFASSLETQSGTSNKFAKVIFEGSKVNLYEYVSKEYVLEFVATGEIISTMGKDFVFGFDKKLASFCSDCETVKTKVSAKEFKNTKEGLTAFCTAYESCE